MKREEITQKQIDLTKRIGKMYDNFSDKMRNQFKDIISADELFEEILKPVAMISSTITMDLLSALEEDYNLQVPPNIMMKKFTRLYCTLMKYHLDQLEQLSLH